MTITNHALISTAERLARLEADFVKLPRHERHFPLFRLACAAYRAGYDTEEKLVQYLTGVYERCEGGADYADVANTAPSAIAQIKQEEKTGANGASKKPVGRPAKITDEEREAWQKWTNEVLEHTEPLFTVASQIDECKKCFDENYRYAKQAEALKAILGGEDFGKNYYWFGDLYDTGTSQFRSSIQNIAMIYEGTKNEYYCPNPLRTLERKKEWCKAVNYLLLEIDKPLAKIDADEGAEEWLNCMFGQQARFWTYIIMRGLLPVRSIVQSGGKSLHVLIPIAGGDPAMLDAQNPDAQTFRARLKRLYAIFQMDPANINPIGKTRTPWGIRLRKDDFWVVQSLEYLNVDAKPISLEDFATALEKIAGEFLPKTEKKRIFCEATFEDYLTEKGAEIWTDDITRRANCEGFRVNDLNALASEIIDDWRDMYKTEVGAEKVRMYVDREVVKSHKNPALEWIQAREWDGVDRINFAVDCLGKITDFEKALARKWLAGCVAILHNGENGDLYGTEGVLTLVGKQGIGKTSWFRLLFPASKRWFRDGAAIDVENKDSLLQLTQFWCIELGEVDDTTRKDQSRLKAVITQDSDYLRQPYRQYAESTIRHCAICASVNREDYLRDETGNRRWWTVKVDKIDWRRMGELDQQQLWAQVEHQWQTADDRQALFRLTDEERAELEEINSACVQDAGWEDIIRAKLGIDEAAPVAGIKKMKLEEILDKVWDAPFRPSKRDRNEIAKSLRHLGIGYHRAKSGWVWEVPEHSPF